MPTQPASSLLRRLVRSVTGRLFLVFAFYLVTDFGFGWGYYRLYEADPSRFLFAADIASAQQRVRAASVRSDLAETRRELAALLGFLRPADARDSALTITRSLISEARGYEVALRRRSGDEAIFRGVGAPVGSVDIVSAQGRVIATLPFLAAATEAGLDSLASILAGDTTRLRMELADSTLIARNSWSLIDFMYFSTITQMTVGYGDIVPNSAIVRGVVICQLVVNGFFLLVLLNFVLVSPIFTRER